jgi:serine O-acetyltransferase
MMLLARLSEWIIFFFYNSYIPSSCSIGDGSVFAYKGIGCVIHKNARIGRNCIIGQNITIGGNFASNGVPEIGDNVYIGPGSRILGKVSVGSNCIIGSNAVVIKDIPDNTVYAGVPARFIRFNEVDKQN